MVHSVSSISSFVDVFTSRMHEWIRSRDVPASLESLLPSSHLAKPSRVFHAQTVALSHNNNKRSTSPPQMTPSPITHPPSSITYLIPSPSPIAPSTRVPPQPHPHCRRKHYTSPPPPPRPQRHHLELDLARSLVCSLSSAAQGRHSGSHDSEPLGP
jgi:hypothetical protein